MGIHEAGSTPLRAAERRQAETQRTLKPLPAADGCGQVQKLIGAWREMFRSNVAIARHILAQLLPANG
jgi:hypothetical protein